MVIPVARWLGRARLPLVVCSAAAVVGFGAFGVPGELAPVAPVSAQVQVDSRAFLKQVLHQLPYPAGKATRERASRARRPRSRRTSDAMRAPGNRWCERCAPASCLRAACRGQTRARTSDSSQRSRATRSRRPRRPNPGRTEAFHRLESKAVPERHPRSAGSGYRRHEPAAPRRCELWVRQYRGGAEDLADADGALPDGGAEDQPHGRRVAAVVPEHRLLQGGRRSRAGRPAARAAVRHARRRRDSLHVPDGCALHHPRGAVARPERAGADLRRAAAPRSEHRRRAGQRLHAARRRRAAAAAAVRAGRRDRRTRGRSPGANRHRRRHNGPRRACAAAWRRSRAARWRGWRRETVRDRRSETAPTESGRSAFP